MTPRTRSQQREQTRQRLLEAAVSCLVDYGYAGTTTQRVQERAEVSRGALLHHFASKAELLVAAIHLIAEDRLNLIHAATDGIEPGPKAFSQVVSAIQTAMSGPPFVAALELWMSSRTDAELRSALVPAERRLGKALRDIFGRALGDQDPRQTRVAFDSLVVLLRGLAVTNVLREDKKRTDDIMRYWLERMAPNEGES
ncbi:TetR family transcriptional regulator [Prauserella sp. PE36]|uniref:TetR/AcrR family transcriptional regulator n=1 Tax=Prauserella sp. PE36 TaxID=1504709 RepID=UPI000D8F141A|nr:TetR/AcrR family transcriptional regulator [Prauserella sp. PE36]PXY23320.1 transcriptional regulator [Prauserella coralliicola]RBM18906.1 TetR family transcriptional regulator [Prauserella sp. PE36]